MNKLRTVVIDSRHYVRNARNIPLGYFEQWDNNTWYFHTHSGSYVSSDELEELWDIGARLNKIKTESMMSDYFKEQQNENCIP